MVTPYKTNVSLGPWDDATVLQHPVVTLLLRVLRGGAPADEGFSSAWLPPESFAYCQLHTALRDILIGNGDGIGLEKLWQTSEADEVIRFFLAYEDVFTRTVIDTLYGPGAIGLNDHRRGGARVYNVTLRLHLVGVPNFQALQIRRPPQTDAGSLASIMVQSVDAFARLLSRDSEHRGECDRPHLVGLSMDFTASGRTRAEQRPMAVSICVSVFTRISVVSSPISTIDSVLKSHGPCASYSPDPLFDSPKINRILNRVCHRG